MIDWAFVLVHSLWILGLSVMLATFSFHDWLRRESGRSFRLQAQDPAFSLPMYTGLWLVALGLVSMSSFAWWERIFWGFLLITATGRMWGAYRVLRASAPPKPNDSPYRPEENPNIEAE